MRLIPLIFLFIGQSLWAQLPYNHRLENGQVQAIGQLVYELEDSYLGIGRGIDTIDFLRGIYATEFDKETGEVLYTDKVTFSGSILQFNHLNTVIAVDGKPYFLFHRSDTIYLSTYSALDHKINIEKKIFSQDSTNSLFIMDFHYSDDIFYVLAAHSTGEKNIVLFTYDMNSDSISELFIDDTEGFMNAVKLLFLENGNMILSYSIYDNGAVQYLKEIDSQGKTIWKYNNEIKREGVVRAFLSIGNDSYILGGVKGRETSEPDGEAIPYLFKFDYVQRKIIKKFDFELKNEDWNKWNGLVEEIIPSHDGESFLCVAELAKVRMDPDTLQGFGMVAKIDEDLNLIWKKKYSFVDFHFTEHSIVDLIATNDGNYLCYGSAVKSSVLPGEIPILSWAIKIDEDGKIVGDTTTATIEWEHRDLTDQIEIFPNPATDHIYINQNEIEDVTYKVYDLNGRLIDSFTLSDRNHSVIISASEWKAGYHIVQLTKDGQPIGNMRMMKI